MTLNPILLQQPQRILFGAGMADRLADELDLLGARRVFVVSSPPVDELVAPRLDKLRSGLEALEVFADIRGEPDIATFDRAKTAAAEFRPDCVVGIGGGSALDVAKLVAALWDTDRPVKEFFGIGFVECRSAGLICMPTTAGTGSDVSPNAILADEEEKLKKGVVSPYLLADASIIDPVLCLGVPPAITAATGLDAMVHCMEAYANLHAHPAVDLIALEGVRRIGGYLERAVKAGSDLDARSEVSLGSLYGGLCLGPVNTAAVHALAYPLGGEFHIPHGVANSLLLTHVFRFNLPAAPDRYAGIAHALGVGEGLDDEAAAEAGLARLVELSIAIGLPQRLRDLNVPEDALAHLATESMKVTRLLKNNPRPLTAADAEAIFRAAW